MIARLLLVASLSLVLLAAPAEAATGSAQVPEAPSIALFAIGLAGLILGRRIAIGRGGKQDGEQDTGRD